MTTLATRTIAAFTFNMFETEENKLGCTIVYHGQERFTSHFGSKKEDQTVAQLVEGMNEKDIMYVTINTFQDWMQGCSLLTELPTELAEMMGLTAQVSLPYDDEASKEVFDADAQELIEQFKSISEELE